MPHSDVYDRLVKDEADVRGQVAYSVYKRIKRDFIKRKQAELGTTQIPDEVLEEFYATQTDYTLDLYRGYAKKLTREFMNELNSEYMEKGRQEMEEKYEKLANSVKPSFWYGVLQSITASFLFLLAGYVILKMSGSWDILLNNLFK